MLTPEWRKSSYSNSSSNCVEVRLDTPDVVAIRDSKNPTGGMLTVTPIAWSTFIADIKHSEFSA
jgi:hypothetical protein